MTPLIRLTGITRSYSLPGGLAVTVLRGIDLDVMEGEFVALMGPSGSGKTTLLHILGCLDRPDEGRYLLAGDEVGTLPDHRLAQVRGLTIGFVFQAFNLIQELHIIDNVALPLLYRGVGRRERQRRASEALDRVGLGHRLSHRPTQLSGGEQQRCAIARALVNKPRLLVADEPTGNLDSKIGADVLTLFESLHANGLTIVMVTHDASVGTRAQRVVHMCDGRLESVA